MVFDVELEHNSVLYLCTVMQRDSNSSTFFAIDIRIPGHGDSLSTQMHSAELHKNDAGEYYFNDAPELPEANMSDLAGKLGEAIESAFDNNGRSTK
jgi:hypothetical protein